MCITIIVFLMHYLDHFLAINPIKRFKNSSYIRSKVARKKKLSHKINISPAVSTCDVLIDCLSGKNQTWPKYRLTE